MSTIDSISASTAISSAYAFKTNELSEETKAKLQALGIDPSTVSSESEAQSLIAQVEAMSKSDQARPNSSDQSLLTKAQSLAEDVGVQYSYKDNLDELCKKISEKIEQLASQYGNDGAKMSVLEDYQRELASIDSRYSTEIDKSNDIFNAMNMISVSNKYALGLK